jgi:hypothetical protein
MHNIKSVNFHQAEAKVLLCLSDRLSRHTHVLEKLYHEPETAKLVTVFPAVRHYCVMTTDVKQGLYVLTCL